MPSAYRLVRLDRFAYRLIGLEVDRLDWSSYPLVHLDRSVYPLDCLNWSAYTGPLTDWCLSKSRELSPASPSSVPWREDYVKSRELSPASPGSVPWREDYKLFFVSFETGEQRRNRSLPGFFSEGDNSIFDNVTKSCIYK
jgi:hypothetical protein